MGWTMKKIRRSEVKRGGIKMRGNKGGALGNIYIYIRNFCLLTSLHAF